MNIFDRINAFSALGQVIDAMSDEEKNSLFWAAENENGWFTPNYSELALDALAKSLQKENLQKWLSRYEITEKPAKSIGIVPAGNIPLVGFHDVLCVLLTGNRARIKLSSKDSRLMRFCLNELLQIAPDLGDYVIIEKDTLKDCDAYIATGSNNSSRYFEQYFGKYPNIIRRNRTSVAVFNGTEKEEDLKNLAKDIFLYYGLGCRNVSKIFLPSGYDTEKIIAAWSDFEFVAKNHRWVNNYDYIRSIYLVNKTPFLDNGFACMKEDTGIFSPQCVVYYEFYDDVGQVREKINENSENLQCVVSSAFPEKNTVAFGKAQFPELWDYADDMDTIEFLTRL
jgi:hypothetical protein